MNRICVGVWSVDDRVNGLAESDREGENSNILTNKDSVRNEAMAPSERLWKTGPNLALSIAGGEWCTQDGGLKVWVWVAWPKGELGGKPQGACDQSRGRSAVLPRG